MMREESRIYRNRIRRARQLRRRIIITCIAICLGSLTGFFCFGFLSSARAEQTAVSYKYFTSIEVHPGDTLSSIAHAYADHHYASVDAYMQEVCAMNHILEDEITAGDYIVVPYYSSSFR